MRLMRELGVLFSDMSVAHGCIRRCHGGCCYSYWYSFEEELDLCDAGLLGDSRYITVPRVAGERQARGR